jgi:hypothetical protein
VEGLVDVASCDDHAIFAEPVMTKIDRGLAWLLVLGAVGHLFGSWFGYQQQPETLVWALSGSLAALLVAAINLLRVGRPHDRALAAVSVAGSLAWAAVALGFGNAIGNVLDARVLMHAVSAALLAAMSVRTWTQSAARRPALSVG